MGENENKKSIFKTSSIVIIVIAAIVIGFTIGMYVTINLAQDLLENESDQSVQENQNEVADTEGNLNEEEYIELDENDEIVTEITDKYDFNIDGLIALLYKEGDFNLDTTPVIPNEEILGLTWGLIVEPQVSDYFSVVGEEISSVDYMSYDGNGTITINIPDSVMKEYIEEIFGSSIQYTDSTFDLTTESLSPFRQGAIYTNDTVIYSDGTYTATYVQGGGAGQPTIEEKIQKVLKYSDRIEIYVNTAFTNLDKDDDGNESRFFYTEYDFEYGKFYNKIGELTTGTNMTTDDLMEKIEDELHTYVYTYLLDEASGEYYLYSFDTVVKE